MLPMKKLTSGALPYAVFSAIGGSVLVLGLLLFINVLANYRAHGEETRALLVVELATWPVPVKQEERQVVPEPKKQPIPERPAIENPTPSKPTLSSPKKLVREINSQAVEREPEAEIMEKNTDKLEKSPSEPVSAMLIEPSEDALPTPVPIFKLTQAPRFLHRALPVYPDTMRAQGLSGVVRLEVLIDKTGRVRRVRVIESAGKVFDEAAEQAIQASSFYPAKVENKPVAVLLRLPVRFNLL